MLNEDKIIEAAGAVARLLKDNDLGEISVKFGDASIVVKAHQLPPSMTPVYSSAAAAPAACVSTNIAQPLDKAAALAESCKNAMTAPIVGTFYSSAAPDKPPFVTVGSRVNKGDVIFIIESMKLMNEIQSEFSGVVKEILVIDGQGVEFHQPIMLIE